MAGEQTLSMSEMMARKAAEAPSTLSMSEMMARKGAEQPQTFGGESVEDPGVIQEMHPDIDLAERAIIKNFGTDIGTSREWLQKRHGDNLIIDIRGDQLVARRPDEKDFKVLDPEYTGGGGFFERAKEVGRDVLDAGYDTVSGLGEGALTGAAGIGAGLATGGVAALPAAAATGGALGAGSEWLRQKIGEHLQVGGPVNDPQVAISGGLGALSPLLFGTGGKIAKELTRGQVEKTLAKGAKNFVPEEAIGKEFYQQAAEKLQDQQKGVLSRLAGGLRTKSTGISNQDAKIAQEMVDPALAKKLHDMGYILPEGKSTVSKLEMADIIEANGPSSLGEIMTEGITEALQNKKQELQEQYTKALGDGTLIDASKFLEPLEALRQKIKNEPVKTKAMRDQYSAIASAIKEHFYERKAVLTKSGETVYKTVPVKEVPLSAFMRMKSQLKHDLANYNVSGKQLERWSTAGVEARNAAIAVERNMSDALDSAIETNIGKKLSSKYKTVKENERFLRDYFNKDNPQKAFNTLRNINTPHNRIVKARLKEFDKQFGTDTAKMAELTGVWSMFGGNKISTIPGEGSGKVLKGGALGAGIGSLLGYSGAQAIGAPGSARQSMTMGGIAGSSLGGLLTSPDIVKSYLKTKIGAKQLGNKIIGAVPGGDAMQQFYNTIPIAPQVLPTAWNFMNQRGE